MTKNFGKVMFEGRWHNLKWHLACLLKVKPEDKKDLPLFYKHCHIFYMRIWFFEFSIT